MPQRAHRILIPLAALLAILPILVHGPTCGHDFDFHLLSWLEASNQFAHLSFPQWAYTPAWNAGEPRFIFYPPISWTLGGILGLILPWQLVPAVFTWIALTLSGFTAHRLARRIIGPPASPAPALFAAILYLANPYMLFTAYERTAYAELLAAAWLPLLFQAILNAWGAPHLASEMWEGTTSTLSLAIPIALLWLTNAPAAVMACYALAFLTLVHLIQKVRHSGRSPESPYLSSSTSRSRLRLALTTTAGLLLGLTLAAFYIFPAAYERKYVQVDLATTTGMRPADHFLFHRMPRSTPGFTPTDIAFHDTVVRTASLISLTLLAAIALAIVLLRTRNRSVPHSSRPHSDEWVQWQVPILALTVAILFLLTPPSAFLWRFLPQLHFLQFPWRLDALLAVILCVAATQAFSLVLGAPSFRFFRKGGVSSEARPLLSLALSVSPILVAAVLIFPAWHLFQQSCDEEDNVAARVALFHSNLGTEPTDEYTPADADPEALHPHNPPYWLTPPCLEFGPPCGDNQNPPSNAIPGPAPEHLTLTLPTPNTLVLNRRAYPGWHITLNGKSPDPPLLGREDGLIALNIPPGTHTIDLHFDETPDRVAGLTLSGTAAALSLLITLKRRKPSLASFASSP